MKRNLKHLILVFLFVMGVVVQAPLAWAVSLTTETQIDTISVTTTGTGILFTDLTTSVSGTIYSNGVAVPGYSGTDVGAGTFNPPPVDGSVVSSIPAFTNAAGSQYAQINSNISAAPAAANSADPLFQLANPLGSDFVVLGSTTAASLSGMVRATDSATLTQFFTVQGTGDVTFSAAYLYSLFLGVSPNENPFTTTAISSIHLEIGFGTAPPDVFDFTSGPISLLDPLDPLNGVDVTNLFTRTYLGIADGTMGYIIARAFTDTQVNSIPEPSTFLLLALGIPGLAILRKKMGCSKT